MRFALIMGAIALSLAGCAKEPSPQPVHITADSYCQIAQKVTWSPDDTRQTITEIRRENAKFDRKCGGKTPTS